MKPGCKIFYCLKFWNAWKKRSPYFILFASSDKSVKNEVCKMKKKSYYLHFLKMHRKCSFHSRKLYFFTSCKVALFKQATVVKRVKSHNLMRGWNSDDIFYCAFSQDALEIFVQRVILQMHIIQQKWYWSII